MEEYSDDDGEDEYYSDDDSYEDSNQGAGGLRPGSYDRDNDTTVQKDGLRRVKHDSTGWNVSLPIMVETPYCGCYSWLVGCLLEEKLCFSPCGCQWSAMDHPVFPSSFQLQKQLLSWIASTLASIIP